MNFNESSLAAAIQRLVDNMARGLHTAIPARIEKYDYETQRASVEPLVKRAYLNGTSQALPVLVNVPVIFPAAGGAGIVFPVKRGDTVLLIFCESSLEKWKSTDGVAEAGSLRHHSLSDAIAIPGLLPFSGKSIATNGDDVFISFGNCSIKMSKNEIDMNDGALTVGA